MLGGGGQTRGLPLRVVRRFPSPRLFKAPSLRATGVFRAATSVAAAPQRGANPPFATEGRLGVGFLRWDAPPHRRKGSTFRTRLMILPLQGAISSCDALPRALLWAKG